MPDPRLTTVIDLKDSTHQKTEYGRGATRSSDADDFRYDLIPPSALRRIARRFGEGARLHGDHNWKKDMPMEAIYHHMMNHMELYRAGDRGDDHLAAVAWGAVALLYYDQRGQQFHPEEWEGDD